MLVNVCVCVGDVDGGLVMDVSEVTLLFSVHFDHFREGNEPGDELTVTYRELLRRVCQFANVLKSQGTSMPPRTQSR